jgi:hypothetical protein
MLLGAGDPVDPAPAAFAVARRFTPRVFIPFSSTTEAWALPALALLSLEWAALAAIMSGSILGAAFTI